MVKRFLFCALMMAVAAACQPGLSTPTVEAPRLAAKQLATVFMSPTPGDAEREATRRALPPSPTFAPPTTVPTATAYVGVFIGAAEEDIDNPPIDPTLFGSASAGSSGASDLLACEIAPSEAFGTIWTQSAEAVRRLGCPIQVMFAFGGSNQVFEGGVMYWRSDTGEIWAIAPGGVTRGEYWYVAEPPEAAASALVAPEGLRVPEGAFGAVWQSVPRVQETLGFAQTRERSTQMAVQRFAGGSLFLDVEQGTVFALIIDGTAFGPF